MKAHSRRESKMKKWNSVQAVLVLLAVILSFTLAFGQEKYPCASDRLHLHLGGGRRVGPDGAHARQADRALPRRSPAGLQQAGRLRQLRHHRPAGRKGRRLHHRQLHRRHPGHGPDRPGALQAGRPDLGRPHPEHALLSFRQIRRPLQGHPGPAEGHQGKPRENQDGRARLRHHRRHHPAVSGRARATR